MESAFTIEKIIMTTLTFTVIPLLLYLRFKQKSIRKAIKELAMSLGWDCKGTIFTETRTQGEYNNISTEIRYWPGSKYRHCYFYIELDRASTFNIRITKENFMHGLGKKTGLAKEIETGIPEFDGKYFISAGDDYNAELYMQKQEVHDAVSQIVDTGFSVEIGQKIKLTAFVSYGKLADIFLLKNILDNAYRLIKELP